MYVANIPTESDLSKRILKVYLTCLHWKEPII